MKLAEEVEARLNTTLYFGRAGVIDFAILIVLAALCAGLLIVIFDEELLMVSRIIRRCRSGSSKAS